MALDQSALLEVLEMLKGAGAEDRIRQAEPTIGRIFIEADSLRPPANRSRRIA